MRDDDFGARVPDYKARVEGLMQEFVSERHTSPGHLRDAIHYAVHTQGKRIRPLLTYATAELLKIPVEVADYPAAAVELIHTYSLVHDDLPAMDDDDLRRGRPTVHKKFDEATAILVGDALNTYAFELLTFADTSPDVIVAWTRCLAEAAGAGGMIGGQATDLEGESRTLTITELEGMHRCKSGGLIETSMALITLAGGRGREDSARKLALFGHHIGLAFQIRDDILDVEATTETLGKPQGSDASNNKSTFVSLLGLNEARVRMEDELSQAEDALLSVGSGVEGLNWLSRYITEREF